MRTLHAPLLVFPLALVTCTDPAIPAPSGVSSLVITGVSTLPPRDDGRVSRITRLSIDTEPGLDQLDAVYLVEGGADSAEVAALAKNRLTAALRARLVSTTHWLEGTLFVQPTRPLEPGKSTLVVVPSKRSPLSVELEVASETPELARRVWTTSDELTFCASSLPLELPTTLPLAHPAAVANVRRIAGVPCFDVDAPAEGQLLPPSVAGLALDPSPIPVERALPARAPCPASAISLEGLCLRVEDDRLILLGDADASRLLLGGIGAHPLLERLAPGARLVVRPLLPETNVLLDLSTRDGAGKGRISRVLTTRKRRRHVVVNEVLVRPPSGASSQRFVELVNDGDTAVDLSGLVLLDGTRRLELAPAMLAPGGFALLTPVGFVDGLGGEVAPPRGPLRITVERLSLGAGLTLIDAEGTVLSRFPPVTSTRTIARGRRTSDRPDDAPDAFGWDLHGRATPGRQNELEPVQP